jgi:hypothetical protein
LISSKASAKAGFMGMSFDQAAPAFNQGQERVAGLQ